MDGSNELHCGVRDGGCSVVDEPRAASISGACGTYSGRIADVRLCGFAARLVPLPACQKPEDFTVRVCGSDLGQSK